MSRRRRLPVVVESLIAGLIAFAVVALVIVLLRPDGDGLDRAEVSDGAVSVDEVTGLGSREQDVVVTGYVFVGELRSVLCSARDGEPPFCEGNAIELEDLDTSRLDLVVPDGAPAYSRDEVTFAGTYSLARLRVREILQ